MKKEVFTHSLKSYLTVSLLGIAAGLLVAFFSMFPHDDLWGLALFSSQTFGFWFFSASLIALFSSRNYVAGISVALYVYFMFYVTGIFKRLAVVLHGYNTMSYFIRGLSEMLAYGLPYAIICLMFAFVLWHGRRNEIIFVILRYLPAVCMLLELILMIITFYGTRQGLFMILVDSACLIAYLLILYKNKTAR
ncbi:MAG: hypothetical protein IJM15_01300 [Erysipelotrichaceae bacterium]|nr:hypothetical protein [Erysipelotrichaceae bacterium]